MSVLCSGEYLYYFAPGCPIRWTYHQRGGEVSKLQIYTYHCRTFSINKSEDLWRSSPCKVCNTFPSSKTHFSLSTVGPLLPTASARFTIASNSESDRIASRNI